jgi:putative mycofactocin binding protein MftB
MACVACIDDSQRTGGAGQFDPAHSRFKLDRSWRLDSQVALRPEPFGALAYHYGTRRLSFLKSRTLVDVVQRLAGSSSAREACEVAGVREAELPRYELALAMLMQSGMIVPAGAP